MTKFSRECPYLIHVMKRPLAQTPASRLFLIHIKLIPAQAASKESLGKILPERYAGVEEINVNTIKHKRREAKVMLFRADSRIYRKPEKFKLQSISTRRD